VTSQDNNNDRPNVRRAKLGGRWGVFPILIAAAIIIAGTWFYIEREDPNPVTGPDAPAATPSQSK
jgi:hypothetical protein